MPHPELINGTRFGYESLLAMDEEAMPQFTTLLQGRYQITTTGEVALLDEQEPPPLGGEWYGDPAISSMRLEPQIAFSKIATDIVMLGCARAPHVGATRLQVGIRVGQYQKLANVLGTRHLLKTSGVVRITDPEPFEKVQLIYENSFGGWDRRAEDARRHRCEARNPVGVGFRYAAYDTDDEMTLPSIEDPAHPFRAYGDTPPPVGFGFISPNWYPRLPLAGTFDAAWDSSRKPLLPNDFDRRFYNSASPGLVASGFLRGDEPVVVVGATPEGRIAFNLPHEPPPRCRVEMRGRNRVELQTVLDTVIVDTELLVLTLHWRAHLPVREGMGDVISIEVLPGMRA